MRRPPMDRCRCHRRADARIHCSTARDPSAAGWNTSSRRRRRSSPSSRSWSWDTSGWSLALIGVGELIVHLGVLSGVRDWDDAVTRWMADHRTPWFDSATGSLTRMADTMGVIVSALILEIVLVFQRRWWALLVAPIAFGLELLTFLTVNAAVGRPRPDVVKLGIRAEHIELPVGPHRSDGRVLGCRRPVAVLRLDPPLGADDRLRASSSCWPRPSARRGCTAACTIPRTSMVGALMGVAALSVTVVAVRVTAREVRSRHRERRRCATSARPTDGSRRCPHEHRRRRRPHPQAARWRSHRAARGPRRARGRRTAVVRGGEEQAGAEAVPCRIGGRRRPGVRVGRRRDGATLRRRPRRHRGRRWPSSLLAPRTCWRRTSGSRRTSKRAVQVGLSGHHRVLDVGRINGERFLVMAGVGFDALMIRDADRDLKDRVGRAAYVWTGARHIREEPCRDAHHRRRDDLVPRRRDVRARRQRRHHHRGHHGVRSGPPRRRSPRGRRRDRQPACCSGRA